MSHYRPNRTHGEGSSGMNAMHTRKQQSCVCGNRTAKWTECWERWEAGEGHTHRVFRRNHVDLSLMHRDALHATIGSEAGANEANRARTPGINYTD